MMYIFSIVQLFWVFFKVGLFTIGGGLASLPLLQQYAYHYDWVDSGTFADMIAVSQSTPGPIGINMATYVGYSQLGFLGSLIATMGMVTPSIIIIYLISRVLDKFQEHLFVKILMRLIRPAVIGIIAVAIVDIAQVAIFSSDFGNFGVNVLSWFDIKGLLLFIVFFAMSQKIKWHPAIYIILAGIVGLILY